MFNQLLSSLLENENLPDVLAGRLSMPGPSVRILHAEDADDHVTGPDGPIEGRFRLSGCVRCGNNEPVSYLTSYLAESARETGKIHQQIKAALELTDEERFGRSYNLAETRRSSDPLWADPPDFSYEPGYEQYEDLYTLMSAVVGASRTGIFSKSPFRSESQPTSPVLVSAFHVLETDPGLVLSQVPLRRAGTISLVLIHVPLERQAPFAVTSGYRGSGFSTRRIECMQTNRPSELLTSPDYDDVWQLAMELLDNQLQTRGANRDRSIVDLPSILTAAEAACE